MKAKWISKILIFLFILIVTGCSKTTTSTNTNEQLLNFNKANYELFVNNVKVFRKSFNPKGFSLISKGEKDQEELNRIFTSFPDNQKLDTRKFDGVNNDPTLPSRYEFLYLNDEKTILIRINLIYSPEFKSTQILSVLSYFPGQVPFIDNQYQKVVSSNLSTYVITYNGGLALVDFLLTNNANSISDKKKYLIQNGETQIFPELEKNLLSLKQSR